MSEQTTMRLIITYKKSAIGYTQRQHATLHALGLRRLGDVADHADTPVIRGMIDKVSHLVAVEEQPT